MALKNTRTDDRGNSRISFGIILNALSCESKATAFLRKRFNYSLAPMEAISFFCLVFF
jgi:hypothetical protein